MLIRDSYSTATSHPSTQTLSQSYMRQTSSSRAHSSKKSKTKNLPRDSSRNNIKQTQSSGGVSSSKSNKKQQNIKSHSFINKSSQSSQVNKQAIKIIPSNSTIINQLGAQSFILNPRSIHIADRVNQTFDTIKANQTLNSYSPAHQYTQSNYSKGDSTTILVFKDLSTPLNKIQQLKIKHRLSQIAITQNNELLAVTQDEGKFITTKNLLQKIREGRQVKVSYSSFFKTLSVRKIVVSQPHQNQSSNCFESESIFVILQDGVVFCRGSNQFGQLGLSQGQSTITSQYQSQSHTSKTSVTMPFHQMQSISSSTKFYSSSLASPHPLSQQMTGFTATQLQSIDPSLSSSVHPSSPKQDSAQTSSWYPIIYFVERGIKIDEIIASSKFTIFISFGQKWRVFVVGCNESHQFYGIEKIKITEPEELNLELMLNQGIYQDEVMQIRSGNTFVCFLMGKIYFVIECLVSGKVYMSGRYMDQDFSYPKLVQSSTQDIIQIYTNSQYLVSQDYYGKLYTLNPTNISFQQIKWLSHIQISSLNFQSESAFYFQDKNGKCFRADLKAETYSYLNDKMNQIAAIGSFLIYSYEYGSNKIQKNYKMQDITLQQLQADQVNLNTLQNKDIIYQDQNSSMAGSAASLNQFKRFKSGVSNSLISSQRQGSNSKNQSNKKRKIFKNNHLISLDPSQSQKFGESTLKIIKNGKSNGIITNLGQVFSKMNTIQDGSHFLKSDQNLNQDLDTETPSDISRLKQTTPILSLPSDQGIQGTNLIFTQELYQQDSVPMSYQSISTSSDQDQMQCKNKRAQQSDIHTEDDEFLRSKTESHVKTLQKMLEDSQNELNEQKLLIKSLKDAREKDSQLIKMLCENLDQFQGGLPCKQCRIYEIEMKTLQKSIDLQQERIDQLQKDSIIAQKFSAQKYKNDDVNLRTSSQHINNQAAPFSETIMTNPFDCLRNSQLNINQRNQDYKQMSLYDNETFVNKANLQHKDSEILDNLKSQDFERQKYLTQFRNSLSYSPQLLEKDQRFTKSVLIRENQIELKDLTLRQKEGAQNSSKDQRSNFKNVSVGCHKNDRVNSRLSKCIFGNIKSSCSEEDDGRQSREGGESRLRYTSIHESVSVSDTFDEFLHKSAQKLKKIIKECSTSKKCSENQRRDLSQTKEHIYTASPFNLNRIFANSQSQNNSTHQLKQGPNCRQSLTNYSSRNDIQSSSKEIIYTADESSSHQRLNNQMGKENFPQSGLLSTVKLRAHVKPLNAYSPIQNRKDNSKKQIQQSLKENNRQISSGMASQNQNESQRNSSLKRFQEKISKLQESKQKLQDRLQKLNTKVILN